MAYSLSLSVSILVYLVSLVNIVYVSSWELSTFNQYMRVMKEYYGDFEFLSHDDEAEGEAKSYTNFGQPSFEMKYPDHCETGNYIIVSIGSSSTQPFAVIDGQVQPFKIRKSDKFGAMADNSDDDVERFIKSLNKQCTKLYKQSCSETSIILANAIGYGANEIHEAMGTDPAELDSLIKIGADGIDIQTGDDAGKAAELIKKIDTVSKEIGITLYVKPRKKPKIENSWAQQYAKDLQKSSNNDDITAIADIGGGLSKSVYLKGGGKRGKVKEKNKSKSVNKMFAAVENTDSLKAARVLAIDVIVQLKDALIIDKDGAKPIGIDHGTVKVYQTGQMREKYFVALKKGDSTSKLDKMKRRIKRGWLAFNSWMNSNAHKQYNDYYYYY